jgi:3-hydroxy-3-methylglutaryl CoA synthase
MKILAAAAFLVSTSAFAVELPTRTFFSGNDVYQWCQHNKAIAQDYVGGMYDTAAHAALAIDSMRNFGKSMPNNEAQVDFAIERVIGFCKPEHATLEQMTDMFCKSLRDNPAQRDGLPAILFNDAGKKAWPCPGR